MPNPGEIWRIRRDMAALGSCCPLLNHHQFSQPARRFLDGDSPSRHVMIVGDIGLLSEYSNVCGLEETVFDDFLAHPTQDSLTFDLMTQHWVTVMVLSHEYWLGPEHRTLIPPPLDHLSHADVLLPPHVSGLSHDIIAETWHIVPMLVDQLCHCIGHRLPFSLYTHLMDMGDQALAVTTGCQPLSHPQVQLFHQAEQQWSEVLRIPITACYRQLELFAQAASIMDKAIQLEKMADRPPLS